VRQGRRLLPLCITVLALWAPAASAQSHNISTIAGTATGGNTGDGGPAAQAELAVPVGVTPMPDGGYLIFQQGGGVVRRVLPDGTITTVAGNGTAGNSGDGGPATSAQLNIPSGGGPTADGGYLIADPNSNVIRRVAPGGTITTPVGNGGAGFGGDNGPATSGLLAFPFDVAVQPDGGYLIADHDNQRIRRVDPNGVITTVAGGGGALGDGGPATAAALSNPSGVALTADGGYLIADTANNRVRKVSFGGTITTVAGTGASGLSGDGAPATSATLNHPARVAVEADGGFVIADQGNQRIRRVAPDGTITTVAGTTIGFSGDGGPADVAQLRDPYGVTVLPSGDYLIADTNNNRIRLVDADPPVPVLTGTTPASPADDNTPVIKGSAPPGTTVGLFTNATCDGPSVAGGPAADLAGAGLPVTVPDNSTTTLHAVAIDSSGNRSPCSPTSVTYVEASAAPPPPLPPPVQGKLVNAVPEKGKVLVKVGKKFVPLESLGRQLPVGSIIDTTHGTVRLTSAKNSGGATQFGHFSRGQFRFTQTKKNPLTTLSMVGSNLGACSRLPRGGAPKLKAAAKKRRRTLFSSVKGRFRTRGRNSAATVRGTSWTMTDTCKGTLTSVKTGLVEVRDFRLRKTIKLKAGRSYLAHAALRKKKRR
jgi:NHL repeat